MDNNSWMNNPNLKNIDPAKLQMLMKMAEQGNGKSQKELLPFLLAAANQSRNNGMAFSDQETDAIIEVMKIGKSPEEIKKINQLKNMVKMFQFGSK